MGLREKTGSELLLSETFDPIIVAEKLRVHFPHLVVESRCRFRLASSVIPSLYTNVKETTIRYTRNAVEYPVASDLPAYEDLNGNDTDLRPIGKVRITALHYKMFGALNEEDANRDGFKTAYELKTALHEFYGDIGDTEVVSIFAIQLEPDVFRHP